MKKSFLTSSLCASFLGAVCIAANAQAEYKKVYAPTIEKGEIGLEANLNMDSDHRHEKDDAISQVYGIEYGATSWWKTELYGEIEKENDTSTKLTHIKWENIFVPFEQGENWADIGFLVELEKATLDHEPNNAEVKLLLEKDIGAVATIVNAGLAHEFGPNHQNGYFGSLAVRSGYRYSKLFEPGLEYYGDFGKVSDQRGFDNQEHQFGPAIYGKLGTVRYDTGVLFGISKEAPDTTVKLNLEYEF